MTKVNTKRLTESAILIATATVLTIVSSFLPGLPLGGSVTIMSALPIILIAYRYGVKWGLLSAFIFSIIQMLTGFKTVSAFFLPGDDQMVLWKAVCVCLIDYILAYTVLGFGGLFRDKFEKPATALAVGSIFALVLRFLMHFTSGAIFFGSYAEWFFTQDAIAEIGAKVLNSFSGIGLATFYSFVYNATYMIPEIIITAIGAVVIGKIPALNQKIKTNTLETPIIK
ncbi:energy-coupled thiamine transporter ThiT [Paludicola sp. MB14-C6]|uniref:energy-coupled thiamine transporter ThiT n=1 Tax=Paludihabitans sp. MB14-C6 TaxID=3070656 RepID=UPI0027DD246A|nr:energy-coupled thiamine transporter ThiT [Paludicola sp. MB14-C6]WMJ21890.1 energy-coupled thiamine transporter ThiT [Paludicola sp. MB14-C6]